MDAIREADKSKSFPGTPITFFTSLNRPHLFLGVDPTLLMGLVGLSGSILFSAHFKPTMIAIAIAHLLLWLVTLRKLAQYDSMLLPVFRAHLHHQRYYAPIALLQASPKLIKPSVPTF